MSCSQGVPYNNRFRSPSGDGDNRMVTTTGLQSVSQSVDLFGHSPSFGHHSVQDHHADRSRQFQRLPSYEQATSSQRNVQRLPSYEQPRRSELSSAEAVPSPHGQQVFRQSSSDVSRPIYPGKPRRVSRQTSADVKRQLFADSRTISGEGKQIVTSVDSGCDEVFVEVEGEVAHHHHYHHDLHDSSLFPSKRTVMVTSTSSTASILPNPYNRINHRIHSIIWCCHCLYFVFFCCLPAIHYMEQCDVEFNRNNQKRAKCLGRTASFFFFTGTLITLSAFALIFFLAIFFTVY